MSRPGILITVVFFVSALLLYADLTAEIPDKDVIQTLIELQRAGRVRDVDRFKRFVSDSVEVVQWTPFGRDSSVMEDEDFEILFDESQVRINAFTVQEDLASNIVSIKSLNTGDKVVRVKFAEKLLLDLGMGRYESSQSFLQVWDLTFGLAGGAVKLKVITFVPEDYYKKVHAGIIKYLEEGTAANENEIIDKYNELVNKFLEGQAGEREQEKAAYSEEENPPPVLLPPQKVTQKIKDYRTLIKSVIEQHYPEMRDKIQYEEIRKIDDVEYYVRVFQRLLTVFISESEYGYTFRLVFSFDDKGEMITLPISILELKKTPQQIKQAEEKKYTLTKPKQKPKTCMILTNIDKLKKNHPKNFKKIQQYIASYGPIIDISSESINPSDWREIDQYLESRFDTSQYDCLFIFGNHDVVPFAVYSNPVNRKDDPDQIVYSDDPYADFDHDPFNDWEIILTRLPDDRGILQDRKSVLFRNVPDGDKLEYPNFVVYANRNRPIEEEVAHIGNPSNPKLLWSDPVREVTFNPDFFNQNNVFMTLHGAEKNGMQYMGEEIGTDAAVSAMNIDQAVAPGAVIMTGICYGASIDGKTSDTSIALRFLKNGARAYIGNTRVGYTGQSTDYVSAFWTKLFKKYLDQGKSPQEAFMLSKNDYAKSIDQVPPVLRNYQHKMYHQMIYLGLPPVRSNKETKTTTGSTNPGSVEMLCKLAEAYLKKYNETSGSDEKYLEKSYKEALKARSIDPTSVLPHITIAKIFEAQGQSQVALTHAKKAVELEPGNPVAKQLLEQLEKKGGEVPPTTPPRQLDPKKKAGTGAIKQPKVPPLPVTPPPAAKTQPTVKAKSTTSGGGVTVMPGGAIPNWFTILIVFLCVSCLILVISILAVRRRKIEVRENIRAGLDVVYQDGGTKSFAIQTSETTIGRDPTNSLAVNDQDVSSFHAEIVVSKKGFLLKDLGSENGTYVNGKKISECYLYVGDEIILGTTKISLTN